MKKHLPFILGGIVLTLIAGGLITFVILSSNVPTGVDPFSIVDTWKAVAQSETVNYHVSQIFDEYLVFHNESEASFYKTDYETPMYDHIPYVIDEAHTQIRFTSISKTYTYERRTNNILRLISGNTLYDYIRYHGDTFTHIDVDDNIFLNRYYNLKYRETPMDYSNQYLGFFDGKMTLYKGSNEVVQGPFDYTFNDKVLHVDMVSAVMETNIYPVNEREFLLVERVGVPGHIWELHIR